MKTKMEHPSPLLKECLQKNALFAWLKADHIEQIASLSKKIEIEKNETFGNPQQNSDGLYIVQHGTFDVITPPEKDDQKEIIHCTLIDGDFFGELSLLGNKKRSGTFRAIEPSSLIFISLRAFRLFERQHPGEFALIITNLARFYSRKIREINSKLSRRKHHDQN